MFRKWETMQYFLKIFYKKGGLFQGLLSDVELFKTLFPKKAKKDANKMEIFFQTLRENFPNTDFFWSVFSPNTGKYGPEETSYLDAFQAVKIVRKTEWSISISLVL